MKILFYFNFKINLLKNITTLKNFEWKSKIKREYSADNNFTDDFKSQKLKYWHINPPAKTNPIADMIDTDISFVELSCCLSKVKGSTPGYDRISYRIIRDLSTSAKQRLLNLQRSRCHFCGESLSIRHILEDCNQYQEVRRYVFGGKSPLQLLENPTRDNIKIICKYITLNEIII